MELKCVIAVVRPEVLQDLERRIGALHVHGITVTDVRGFGVHPNYFASDWTTEHIKIEIFTTVDNVDGITKTIIDVAKAQSGEDGIIAVVSVEAFWRVRTASESEP
ncbi:P-II family nitrogen regulator [Burkholderia cepacia]|uniref:P-II family nitrogen regulator n=1 Tax=Burkholderia cepacia TaxID=292 RepID=A0AAX2RS79_BURCE|nr:P-II family nitrogen regulator [Burkholderia cepacia]TES59025.1 P-II family nitrogen regulator [Burkholderia cepacia]TET01608.1 P-II family nitrogen regulator [Burkholderia cepacia]TEU47621.1 P-II family nitrogen regulator [Burkholderia cepacia]TEU53493.1 P-II family nitrogen regulator [Burkholderia cepacia]TEV02099.1 P-II family nitrogen regulator [Burkholderia cepacia]